MSWDLTDKVVVITGGADGIGYNIGDKYLQKSAKVIIILDINEELGIEAVKNLTKKYGKDKALFLKCDVTIDNDKVFEEIFRLYNIDILVNSAGICDETNPKKVIDINLTSLIECSLKVWERMRKDKSGNGGTIVNLSSIFGILTGPNFPVYQASKHAVVAFTKSLGHSANFQSSGVRVVAICPGFTETKLLNNVKNWNQTCNFLAASKSFPSQKVDAVGNAAVEIYERADSGTVWKIEGAKPIINVTIKYE